MITFLIAMTLGGWTYGDGEAPPVPPAWTYRDADEPFPARSVPVALASTYGTPAGGDARGRGVTPPSPAPPAVVQPRWHAARDYPGWLAYGAIDPATGLIVVQGWHRVSAPAPAYYAAPRQLRCVGGNCR